jgi:hypothetical protein
MGEPRPGDLPRQAEHVEHARIVTIDAGRQHRSFPCGSGQLETVEHRHGLAQSVRPRQPIGRVHVLPLEQEPHEIRRTHGLDLGAQPVHGIPMDPREQRPVTPLQHGRRSEVGGWLTFVALKKAGLSAVALAKAGRPGVRGKTAAQRHPRFERQQRGSLSPTSIPNEPASAAAVVGPAR